MRFLLILHIVMNFIFDSFYYFSKHYIDKKKNKNK